MLILVFKDFENLSQNLSKIVQVSFLIYGDLHIYLFQNDLGAEFGIRTLFYRLGGL